MNFGYEIIFKVSSLSNIYFSLLKEKKREKGKQEKKINIRIRHRYEISIEYNSFE